MSGGTFKLRKTFRNYPTFVQPKWCKTCWWRVLGHLRHRNKDSTCKENAHAW